MAQMANVAFYTSSTWPFLFKGSWPWVNGWSCELGKLEYYGPAKIHERKKGHIQDRMSCAMKEQGTLVSHCKASNARVHGEGGVCPLQGPLVGCRWLNPTTSTSRGPLAGERGGPACWIGIG